MKRKTFLSIVTITMALAICACALVGCNNAEPEDEKTPVTVNIVVPDGSPAIAIAKLVGERPVYEGYNINYSVVEGATQISSAILNNTAQIAIAPLNLGATMYNKGMGVKLVTTNVQGSLYMVGKNIPAGATNGEKLEALKGKIVYNIGQGATPDITFRYILDSFGIEYAVADTPTEGKVTFKYVSSGSELIPLLKQGIAEYGILGEPAVTRANANAGTSTIFDIQELWGEATESENAGFPQAGLFVKNDLLVAEHSAFINWLVDKISENDDWASNNPEVVTEGLSSIGSASLAGLTSAMIDACNISTIKALNAKSAVNTYLGALYAFNPNSIGGSMPDDNFYYTFQS